MAVGIGDIPHIAASTYGSISYVGDNWASPINQNFATLDSSFKPFIGMSQTFGKDLDIDQAFEAMKKKGRKPQSIIETETETMANPARRMVQVIVVDPNENITLEDCCLYQGTPKMTDATDQELFFELDIKQMLASHNEKRTKVVDKKVKDRVEYLEPAKVRDLKMVVVNIASF